MGEFLLVTIQVDMHDRLALTLQDDLTAQIVKHRARGVLIDISALEMVDSFIGTMLGTIAAMARLLDAADGGGGHAAFGGDYAGGTGAFAARDPHRARRGKGHGRPRVALAEAEETMAMQVLNSEAHGDSVIRRHRLGAPGGAEESRRAWASGWWIRPSSSRPPANWRATRSITAGAAPCSSK